ncbi:class I SAM-dependent methyltransferase [Gammaproteobacteria bacterium]|nr:class I SAM-dependent methyltransferase [Gammaproteobacteria bacterium]
MKFPNKEQNSFDHCYICGSSRTANLYLKKSIVECQDCKFAYYKFLPSKECLDQIYANYSRDSYITTSSHQKILKNMNEILIKGDFQSVLDIACGECYHLDALKELNPNLDLYASEHISAKNNVISKGYKFLNGEFYPETDLKFDLIIFTEAIEHINDPLDFLLHAYNLLKEGGMIYMTTPCFSSLERRIMNENWGMIIPPEHVSYFSKSSLDTAMQLTGFKKVYSRSLNISIFRVIQYINSQKTSQTSKEMNANVNNINAQEYSDKAQAMVTSNRIFNLLKEIINVILNWMGLGSSLQALYRKN